MIDYACSALRKGKVFCRNGFVQMLGCELGTRWTPCTLENFCGRAYPEEGAPPFLGDEYETPKDYYDANPCKPAS